MVNAARFMMVLGWFWDGLWLGNGFGMMLGGLGGWPCDSSAFVFGCLGNGLFWALYHNGFGSVFRDGSRMIWGQHNIIGLYFDCF